jgi:hypothetical protein
MLSECEKVDVDSQVAVGQEFHQYNQVGRVKECVQNNLENVFCVNDE